MVGWHHQLNGHEFVEALAVGDGQGSLVCCSPWGCKESGMTANELKWADLFSTSRNTIQNIEVSASASVLPMNIQG